MYYNYLVAVIKVDSRLLVKVLTSYCLVPVVNEEDVTDFEDHVSMKIIVNTKYNVSS